MEVWQTTHVQPIHGGFAASVQGWCSTGERSCLVFRSTFAASAGPIKLLGDIDALR